jgi:hypothetical protein
MTSGKLLVVLIVSSSLAVWCLTGCGGKKEEGAKPQEAAETPAKPAEESAEQLPAAEPEAAEPGEGGSFYVESFPPGAEIVVNGEKAPARTPYFFENRKPGHYEIFTVLPGYVPTPAMHELDVTAGSLDTLTITGTSM